MHLNILLTFKTFRKKDIIIFASITFIVFSGSKGIEKNIFVS